MNPSTRRIIPTSLIVLALLAPLPGCAPLVVTGVGAGLHIVDDRRSAGVYLLDEEIELKAASRLNAANMEGAHANFASFNRRLLITGEAPTDEAKAKISELAKSVANVREVLNEMTVAAPSGFVSRSNDSYITAKVKARFIDDNRFNAHHVQVVTEGEVVYLLGLVYRNEGEAAGEVASGTSGPTRVIKVFEYID